MNLRQLTFTTLLCVVPYSAGADDWPQWMGPGRNGIWNESGVVTEIPEKGLPVVWRAELSGGYSGPAVSAGRVFVTDFLADDPKLTNDPGTRDVRKGVERIHCLDLKTGKTIWKQEYPRAYKISYAAGPRATPTVDGDLVYALGAEGDLLCLKVASGEIVWKQNLAETYQAETPIWGHSAHPLVHGDLVYCLAGGKDHVVVALNKLTGKEVWHALSAAEIGYCPPTIAKIGGKDQLVIWHADAVCGLDLQKGNALWTHPLSPKYGMAIAAPQFQKNRMFASGIGEVGEMVEFDAKGAPQTAWKGLIKQCVFSANATSLWIDDTLYGADCGSGMFVAVDAKTGKRLWETFDLTTGVAGRRASHGTAFVVQNKGLSYVFAETGELVVAKLSPSGFEIKGRMKVVEPTGECFGRPVVWSHPAFAERSMIARNDKEIVCISLAAPTTGR